MGKQFVTRLERWIYGNVHGYRKSDVADLLTEYHRLRSALEKYGRHDKDCKRSSRMMVMKYPNTKCTCGLDALKGGD